MRKRRNHGELREASKHLDYEFEMLDRVAQALSTGVFGDSVVANGLLESFTIHARVLLHFFFATDPREDDVIADDFFELSTTWPEIRHPEPAALACVRQRVGKEVAHLTYARLSISEEAKQWNVAEIASTLRDLRFRFVGAALRSDLAATGWSASDT